jgi:outer membrane lipoprotein-sorting protein
MNILGRAVASISFATATLAVTAIPLPAQAKPGHLEEVLHQMDEASTKFQSAQADFRWDIYERVVKQTTTQNGTIYFKKVSSKTEMGAVIAPPSARIIEYKNGTLRIFDPGSDHMTTLSAGSNRAQYETFLTLGFGGSGHDLANVWNITDQGSESMSDGDKTVEVAKLDLVSKDPAARSTFTHITIWIDVKRAVTLKQQFFTPAEDQKTVTYTHIRYDQKIDTKPYEIKTDKKTTYDNH